MPAAHLTLVSKPGCHLCDDARAVVTEVLADFDDVDLAEVSILDYPDLHEKYVEEIPVLLLNGAVHNIWRVDADRLRRALEEATA